MHNRTEVVELKTEATRLYHGRVRDCRDRRVSLVRLSELRLPVKEKRQ